MSWGHHSWCLCQGVMENTIAVSSSRFWWLFKVGDLQRSELWLQKMYDSEMSPRPYGCSSKPYAAYTLQSNWIKAWCARSQVFVVNLGFAPQNLIISFQPQQRRKQTWSFSIKIWILVYLQAMLLCPNKLLCSWLRMSTPTSENSGRVLPRLLLEAHPMQNIGALPNSWKLEYC